MSEKVESGLEVVARFLLGEGEMDGCWFGDEHPSGKRLWWRQHLRAAMADAERALSERDAEIQRQREGHRTTWTQLEQVKGLLRNLRIYISGLYMLGSGRKAAIEAIDAALSQQAEPEECLVCCSDEPHTGTCGSSDPRALCNRAEAEPAPAQLVECDACPTSGGCLNKCMKVQDEPAPAQDDDDYMPEGLVGAIMHSEVMDIPSMAANALQEQLTAPAQDERTIDTAPLIRFIFSEYGSPEMAGNLPDDVVRVVRALESPARPAQTAPQPEQSGLADLPYQTLFNAIAAATDAGDSPVSISVKAFRAALSAKEE